MKQNAFSLIELSIVLVILGLLTGGILAGQSLIRAAELRAVATEYQRYSAGVYTFRDKYFALPGDFRDGTKFWGFAGTTAAPSCVSNSGITAISTPGTCDGNGDGTLSANATANATSEQFRTWQHLALAGLIEGTYTGNGGPAAGVQAVPGTNVPRTRLGNGGWSAFNAGTPYAGDTMAFAIEMGNFFVMGGTTNNDKTQGGIIKPEELWNIDTKVDDGKPAYGRVIAYNWSGCTAATTKTMLNVDYKLTETGTVCALIVTNL